MSGRLTTAYSFKLCKCTGLDTSDRIIGVSDILMLFNLYSSSSAPWLSTDQSNLILQCGGRLAMQMAGTTPEVFARLLRGLAATKLTKPGNFRTADGAAFAVRCSYKVGRHTTDHQTWASTIKSYTTGHSSPTHSSKAIASLFRVPIPTIEVHSAEKILSQSLCLWSLAQQPHIATTFWGFLAVVFEHFYI